MTYLFIVVICLLSNSLNEISSFRVLNTTTNQPANSSYFVPFEKGFVGQTENAANFIRERVNEGAFQVADQELIYGGPNPRQPCPQMVGPFSDGSYYCTAKEYGYCDRRSGTCFCNVGYEGIDCSNCIDTHYRVGSLCYPKILCPNDCSGAGQCNYNNGTCTCLPHRVGLACETMLCTVFDNRCESCDFNQCFRCTGGYYLTGTTKSRNETVSVCSSCYDFDPRCAECTSDDGCTGCADPVLTSIRRSGYRSMDLTLPIEEQTREFSITLPFGTKSAESFAEAENYMVIGSKTDPPLNLFTKNCSQGLNNTAAWVCDKFLTSNIVCGHYGVFRFAYPNYRVPESYGYLRLTVIRSGGGYGDVDITYNIKHITTNDSDVTATAQYTTNQKLSFKSGIVEKSFLINILEDNIVEEDEVFQVYLEVPEGGGSVGPQFRTNVTIVDDDLYRFSSKLSKLVENTTTVRAGDVIVVTINAAIAYRGEPMIVGGEKFYAVIENDEKTWSSNNQRNSIRISCEVQDNQNGTYTVYCNNNNNNSNNNSSSSSSNGNDNLLATQGQYQLRVWNAFPGGLLGNYYYDGFFQNLGLQRIDRTIDFNWGYGRLLQRGSDYVSIRWTGLILPSNTQIYYFYFDADDRARLWIDGELIQDHWQESGTYLDFPREKFLIGQTFHEIVIEYLEVTGIAFAHLYWGSSPTNLSIITSDYLYSLYEIDRSPVEVIVTSSYTSGNTTEAYGNGLFNGITLQPSYFTVCPRDIYYNLRDDNNDGNYENDMIFLQEQDFKAYLYYISNNPISLQYQGIGSQYIEPILVFNRNTYCFDSFYIPQLAGIYQLEIIYGQWRLNMSESIFGSPFQVTIIPSKTFGPYCDIIGIETGVESSPYLAEAGKCYNFTIVARDASRNLVLHGNDQFEVYSYQVQSFQSSFDLGDENIISNSSTTTTTTTTIFSSHSNRSVPFNDPIVVNSMNSNIRFGIVYDHKNGNYSIQICPITTGIHELFILLNGAGVSNQEVNANLFRRNRNLPTGEGTYLGQYVANSPYILKVINTYPSAIYTTADGIGLRNTTVGITTQFIITVRDAYHNILLTNTNNSFSIDIFINESPDITFMIQSYGNGSIFVQYIPIVSQTNTLNILLNNIPIQGSPFPIQVVDGQQSVRNSITRGQGIVSAIAGSVTYFEVIAYDIDGNRKTTTTDIFYFNMSGSNNITGYLLPCSNSIAISSNYSVCDIYDNYLGRYYGIYIPIKSGISILSVFYEVNTTDNLVMISELYHSPFRVRILPTYAKANNSIIRGSIYDNIAGEIGMVNIQLYDPYQNKLISGGNYIDLVLSNFYVSNNPTNATSITPIVIVGTGTVIDTAYGSYIGYYNVTKTGLYDLIISVVEPGISVSFYRGIQNFSLPNPRFVTISPSISFNISTILSNTSTIFKPPREEYFSLRYVGLIIPIYAEVYSFIVHVDSSATCKVYVGESNPGDSISFQLNLRLVIDTHDSNTGMGNYEFISVKPYNIIIEYTHQDQDPMLQILWQSISMPTLQEIPSTSLFHWSLANQYPITIHPSKLNPSHSIAIGNALTSATAGLERSVIIQARDVYDNLLNTRDDPIQIWAVGSYGKVIRGVGSNTGNGTYLASYYPIYAGIYRLYITIGCCPPNPAVGIVSEILFSSSLFLSNVPFTLTVHPNQISASHSIATGTGLLGGYAGFYQSFQIYLRDFVENPTTINSSLSITISSLSSMINVAELIFQDIKRGVKVDPANVIQHVDSSMQSITILYNMTKAGSYSLKIFLKLINDSNSNNNLFSVIPGQPIKENPFHVVIHPYIPVSIYTKVQGTGLHRSKINQMSTFDIILYDRFSNRVISGDKYYFYIRFVGNSVNISSLSIIPRYEYIGQGRYRCSYMANTIGPYNLTIKLLNSSGITSMGSGLRARYYTTSDIDNLADDQKSIPIYSEIVNNIDFSSSLDGFIWSELIYAKISSRFNENIIIGSTGQAIRWDGYLVIPRDDSYTFRIQSKHANVTVYLDNQIIWDYSNSNNSNSNNNLISIPLSQNIAYLLSVRAIISEYSGTNPIVVQLLWKPFLIGIESVVPMSYLYNNAENISNSPFFVTVSS